MRYIDADKFLDELDKQICSDCIDEDMHCCSCGVGSARAIAKGTPTADVVAVVRCKDCKHHPDNGGECDRSITHTSRDYVCEVNTYRYIGLDYCSYGERRANDGT
jgi:hypothetical protein